MDGGSIIIKTLDIDDERLKKVCKYISFEKKNKVDKLLNKKDKIQTVVAEILIRSELIKYFSIKNENISFNKNLYGKPYVDKIQNFHFNISHSGEFVVIAISNEEIGIDIEKVNNIEYLDIAKNFFTNEDVKYITCQNEEDRLDCFYEIWTLKESYIKFNGKGLSIPLNSFAISFDKGNSIKINESNNYTNHILNQINILPGYKLAICKLNNDFLNIKILNQNKLINDFLALNEKEKK